MKKTNTLVPVYAAASYQLFGDVDGRSWMTETLAFAVDQEDLDEFNVESVITGIFGLQMVSFTVKIDVPSEHLAEAKEYVRTQLNKFVGDTDVAVYFVGEALA